MCCDRIPTTLSLTAADRADGHQYAAAEKAEGSRLRWPTRFVLVNLLRRWVGDT